MWKRVLLAVVGLIATIAVLGYIKATQIGAMIAAGESMKPPPEAVSTVDAREEQWAPRLQAVGSVVAARGVTVSSEVPGLVTKLGFESGQKVKQGDLLVQLDTSIERAQLASAKASLELAEVNLSRARGLAEQKVNAPQELDTAEATARQARAQVENIQAQIAKKSIRAPFSGKLGIRRVELGQILDPGTPIVELQDLDKVYVDFFLPQQELPVLNPSQAIEVKTDASPGRTWTGEIQTIESSVDVATRNVRVRGVLANEDGALRPGIFVEVRIVLPTQAPKVVVPATAIIYAPYGNSLYLVEDAASFAKASGGGPAPGAAGEGKAASDGTPSAPTEGLVARQVFVELGERRGDFVAVESGLSAGQKVVSAGAFKLRNGVSVVVDNSKALDPKLAPKPRDS